MKKTANVNRAIERMADKIQHVNNGHKKLRGALMNGDDKSFEMIDERVRRAAGRYYATGSAYAFLFDATFDELERMALDSLGYDCFESADKLWGHTLEHGE